MNNISASEVFEILLDFSEKNPELSFADIVYLLSLNKISWYADNNKTLDVIIRGMEVFNSQKGLSRD